MADEAVKQPMVDAASQVATPVATMGFGSREAADAWRMAQQTQSDDSPMDVNANAFVQKSQILTFDVLGKEFAGGMKIRDMVETANTDWREIHKGRLFGAKKDA